MGDVGSSTMGFVFAGLAIAGENTGSLPLITSLALGGPFVIDATLTLIRRIMRGEEWHSAHRSHAYQRAVQSGLSHKQVSTIVLVTNMLVGGGLIVTYRAPALQMLAAAGGLATVLILYLLVERRRPMFLHDRRRVPEL